MSKEHKKKWLRGVLRVVVIAVLAVGGFFGWEWWKSQQVSDLPDGIVSGNGRIEAVQVDVATKFAGRLGEVAVDEGDLVEHGQVLATMDTSQMEALLAQAKAQQAEVTQSVSEAQANIEKSESELSLSLKDVARSDELISQKAMSQAQFDEDQSTAEKAGATLKAVRAAFRTQEFALDAAKAHVHEIQTELDDAVLTSPVRGRVLYRLSESGEVLPAGGKVLTILDMSDIYMEVYVPSDAAARLQIGGEARIVFDVAPQYAAHANVTFVSPEAQFTPKQVETANERDKLMFRVKVQLPPDRVESYIDRIKTGIRGVAYLRVDPSAVWPERLQQPFPVTPPTLVEASTNTLTESPVSVPQ